MDKIHDIPNCLLNERYNDRYFDVVDALEEAKRIHIANGNIIERLNALCATDRRIRIGETGFGAGRVVVALMDALEERGVSDAVIDYLSVELHPISAYKMSCVLDIFRDRADCHINSLIAAYKQIDISVTGWHSAAIRGKFGVINLCLYVGEALDMVESLSCGCAAWFLDGHAPKKNPDMWRPALLSAIGSKTDTLGSVTAFTVAGHIRRGLQSAGFRVKKVSGCGGKKEALLGIFCEKC